MAPGADSTESVDEEPTNDPKEPPYRAAGAVLLLIVALIFGLTWVQFRGYLEDVVPLVIMAERAGLSMDPGSKVTFNGVPIGRLTSAGVVTEGDDVRAKLLLDVKPQYLELIPSNVDAQLRATTVFGNKYISLLSPADPSSERLEPGAVINASATTTEFNTVFETIMGIAQQIDPVKLNQTLTATAQALNGLGDKFGRSLVDGNDILGELNARMPQIRRDVSGLIALSDTYADAAPDLFDGLDNATITARAMNDERGAVDAALLSAVGFGNNAADVLERGGPYLVRGAQDLLPTSALLDYYSPQLLCSLRNYHNVAPKYADMLGGNGYSLVLRDQLVGAGNRYVFPDNLPRVNARGGPGGRPGCWQPITRDLWPMPYLVMDTGASIAPYNHFELGQPIMNEYVWGRQVGEDTINP
ncbi:MULTISPECIES: MCE family protein [Mycobacteriaceae]|nr:MULTISPECIES: MCE family protein [Mycobacteriaceae]AHC26009.2 MCE-family protein MCE1A [Mycolicibacterium neoaurum VKM Ac-1815D]AMO08397.1 MCE-family protein MCE1A [Mycolicibacterium neoaurum]AXK78266.1 MCE family protein [Mycolicibacterium neoaurum]KJQ51218.1 MCE-family protein MCE1A [Mycolicibacterium neoaurum]KUM08414.1 MCE-family protein MCE1A [Mycolicibacterium neoaurum]